MTGSSAVMTAERSARVAEGKVNSTQINPQVGPLLLVLPAGHDGQSPAQAQFFWREVPPMPGFIVLVGSRER